MHKQQSEFGEGSTSIFEIHLKVMDAHAVKPIDV